MTGVQTCALPICKTFKTKVSSKKYLTMECEVTDCPRRVHGYRPQFGINWKVSDVVQHTCKIDCVPQDHRNISSTLIARLLYSEIVQGKAMEAKAIIHKVFTRFKYTISYGKTAAIISRLLAVGYNFNYVIFPACCCSAVL